MRDSTPRNVHHLREERGLRRLDQAITELDTELRRLDQAITELDTELRRVADEDDLTRVARAVGVYREGRR